MMGTSPGEQQRVESAMRLDLVVGVVIAFAVLGIIVSAYRDRLQHRVGVQVAIAVAIGLISAIVVLSLKADIVPDGFEMGGDVVLIVVVTVLMLIGSVYRAWRG